MRNGMEEQTCQGDGRFKGREQQRNVRGLLWRRWLRTKHQAWDPDPWQALAGRRECSYDRLATGFAATLAAVRVALRPAAGLAILTSSQWSRLSGMTLLVSKKIRFSGTRALLVSKPQQQAQEKDAISETNIEASFVPDTGLGRW